MIKVNFYGPDGNYLSRRETVSLYASDMDYVPYLRKLSIEYDATADLEIPAAPVILHAKLRIPDYGRDMWVIADNCGEGYPDGVHLDFIYEAAESRIWRVRQILSEGEFIPSAKCLSMLQDAEALLAMCENSPKRHAYAMKSLSMALWAGELAAVERAQARILRQQKRDVLFGCGLCYLYPYDGSVQLPWKAGLYCSGIHNSAPQYPGMPTMREAFDSVFNYGTIDICLNHVEPVYGKPDYSEPDHYADALLDHGFELRSCHLWWNHSYGVPDWLRRDHWDAEVERELRRTITRTVKHYQGRIKHHLVINECHDWCNMFNMTKDEQIDLTKLCVDVTHEADPEVDAIVNTCFMFGEYAADGRTQWGPTWDRQLTPYDIFVGLEERGAEYDTVGIQLYNPARDMLELDRMIERFARFGKNIEFTELGVPSVSVPLRPDTTPGDIYCLDYMYYGIWHGEAWTERLQADWLEQFYTIAYSHPEVGAIDWQDAADPGYVPDSALFTREFEPKESYFRLKNLEKNWGFHFGR